MSDNGNNLPDKAPASTLSERVRSLRLTDADATPEAASWWRWLPWALCALLLCAAGVFALEAFSPISDDLLKKLAEERGLNLGKDGKSGAGGLQLPGMPASASGEIAFEAKGNIVPIQLIQVSPKIGGTVLKLNIEEGKEVPKGFILAELEDVEYSADFNQMQARLDKLSKYRDDEIEQAKAELDDALAQREQAQSKFKRYTGLKLKGSVSPEDYELVESMYRSMESRVKQSQLRYELLRKGPRDAEIDGAKADLRKAKWRYDNTRVEAPITGVILSKKTEEGNFVSPTVMSSMLSASLCEMADLYKLEVDLAIAERDIAKVFKDQECRIRPEAFPNRIYTGYVSRIMPMADRGKSSIPVRVIVRFPAVDAKGQPLPMEKQGEFLRPEMGAIVTFMNRKAK